MADTKFKMSRERYEELQKELDYLQTVREKEVSELIKEARSYGDLSENSEYDEAKTEQGKLYSKIAEYKNLLENAEIVEHTTRAGVIGIGSRVTVLAVRVPDRGQPGGQPHGRAHLGRLPLRQRADRPQDRRNGHRGSACRRAAV